jgi:hypothetical protein
MTVGVTRATALDIRHLTGFGPSSVEKLENCNCFRTVGLLIKLDRTGSPLIQALTSEQRPKRLPPDCWFIVVGVQII